MQDRVKRAVVYCRVSSQKQAEEGLSLDAQRTECEAWIRRHGYKLEGTYTDAGYSGGLPYKKRPALREIIERVECDEVDLIVVIKLDRLFRSLRGFYDALGVLERHNCGWVCIKEPELNVNTAAGEMMLSMMLVVAQFERRNGGERVKLIQQDAVRKGLLITGSAPYGYEIGMKDGKKTLIPKPAEIQIVKDALEHYVACGSHRATRLYIKEKYGKALTWQQFNRIIHNDLYLGMYRGVQGYCEATIPRDLMDKARRINTNFNGQHWDAKHVFIFQGILRCPVCGNTLTGTADKKKNGTYSYYYRCQKHANRLACDWRRTVGEARIEPLVVEEFSEYLKKERYILKQEAKKKPDNKRALDSIENKMRRLADLYIDGKVSLQIYEDKMQELERELELLKPKQPPRPVQREQFKGKDFKTFYNSLTREDKRAWWRQTVRSITISEDGKSITEIQL